MLLLDVVNYIYIKIHIFDHISGNNFLNFRLYLTNKNIFKYNNSHKSANRMSMNLNLNHNNMVKIQL